MTDISITENTPVANVAAFYTFAEQYAPMRNKADHLASLIRVAAHELKTLEADALELSIEHETARREMTEACEAWCSANTSRRSIEAIDGAGAMVGAASGYDNLFDAISELHALFDSVLYPSGPAWDAIPVPESWTREVAGV